MGSIGIEWVNQYNGNASNLENNDNNARGFYNTLQGVKQFEYGDNLAWDEDFEKAGKGSPSAGTDTTYADNADIVFFSGHGWRDFLLFGRNDRDNGRARNTEMELGDQDLEWIVFDGCQALEFDGVFGRWGWGVFKGLHYILGFATICYDKADRGKKFAQRLNNKWRMREAWIKACKETEVADTKFAYLRANEGGISTYNDHWHGKGDVSLDPDNPDNLWYLNGNC
ncbi:hypothetical protein IMCC3317_26580 [Kordia antarctica]|uniref:Uncharacterized protein n=1 Tax=Kordia antarctica TaxID=1218801 RepID=A0A7L4ZLG6_9FLAO|nr:DUF6345 domain-containing protein [Kordia antarctica]QHI37279.1 hypothetical protein IMCC3317_26580 [Kordia antarctica]